MLWTGGRTAMILGADLPGLYPGRTSALAHPFPPSIDGSGPQIPVPPGPASATLGAYHGPVVQGAPYLPTARIDRIPILRPSPFPETNEGARRRVMLAVAIPPVPGGIGGSDPGIMAMATGPGAARPPAAAPVSIPAAPPPLPPAGNGGRRRWTGSAWMLWRENGKPGRFGTAGQLGGAQAGVRIDRHLGRPFGPVPLSVYARLTTALREPAMPEAALGIAAYPVSGRLPLTIGIERRIALDGKGRNAFALFAATGLNPTRVAGGLIAEGYAQAGMVGLSHKDLFADGRAVLTVPLDREGRTGAGIALSGGAQPGLSRLDAGPVFQTRLPLGRIAPRLSVEWRQRIAGSARPGSGLTIMMTGDF